MRAALGVHLAVFGYDDISRYHLLSNRQASVSMPQMHKQLDRPDRSIGHAMSSGETCVLGHEKKAIRAPETQLATP